MTVMQDNPLRQRIRQIRQSGLRSGPKPDQTGLSESGSQVVTPQAVTSPDIKNRISSIRNRMSAQTPVKTPDSPDSVVSPILGQARQSIQQDEQSQPDPNRSVMGEVGTGLKRGLGGIVEAVGGLGEMAAGGIESVVGKNVVTDQYREMSQFINMGGAAVKADNPRSHETETFTARNIAGTVAEAAPQMAAQVGMAAATGGTSIPFQIATFAGTAAAPVVGQQFLAAKDFYQKRGDSDADGKAAAEAGIAGLITMATSLLPGAAVLQRAPGGQQALRMAAANVVGRIGGAAGGEALQEMSEQVLTDSVAALIRQDPVTYNRQYWEQIGLAGIAGAVLGGAARGTMEAKAGRGQNIESSGQSAFVSQQAPPQDQNTDRSLTTPSVTPPPALAESNRSAMERMNPANRLESDSPLGVATPSPLTRPQSGATPTLPGTAAIAPPANQESQTPVAVQERAEQSPSQNDTPATPAQPSPPSSAKSLTGAGDIDSLKYPDLRKRLKALGLDDKGKVAVLRERLRAATGGSKEQQSQPDTAEGKGKKAASREAFESSAEDMPDSTLKEMVDRIESGDVRDEHDPLRLEVAKAEIAERHAYANSDVGKQEKKEWEEGYAKKLAREQVDLKRGAERIKKYLGLEVGDTFTPSADIGPVLAAGKTYTVKDSEHDFVRFVTANGSTTWETIPKLLRAKRDGITWTASKSDTPPVAEGKGESPTGKQAWEMKLDEFGQITQYFSGNRWNLRGLVHEQRVDREGMSQYFTTEKSANDYIEKQHKAAIRQAIADGKEVPAEVLAEYPHLAKMAARKRPTNQRGIVSLPVAKSVAFLKRNLTSAGDLPAPVFAEKIANDGRISSTLIQARFTLRDFAKASKKAYGSKKLSLKQQTEIDDVLRGDKDVTTLPEPMRDVVTKMRMEVDALSQRMIDLGVIEGDLAAKVADNMGVYLTRSYRAFDDPKWAEKVPQEIRNKAKALLRAEYPGKSPEQIDGLIETLLYEGKAAESPIAMIKGGKLGAKDLSILTKRKGISPEIRALWGEYRDPRQNYTRSMAKMAHLIGNHQFLQNVREAGLGTFFHEAPIVKDDQQFKTRIAADESSVMHPLNGLYTTPEIKTAFEEILQPQNLPDWFKLYMKANGFVKYAKTVLSVVTHVRNFVSNSGFAVANGHWRAWKVGGAARATMTSIGAMNSQKWRDYYRHLVEIGVVNESPRANELHDMIRDASKKSVDELLDPGLANLPKKVGRLATEAYRAEDDFWKVFAFENEKARYSKALKGKSEAEIEKLAAEIVRNTYPTYSMIPRAIKGIRRFPLVGAFVSFPAEIARTSYNVLTLAAKELGTPELRAIGSTRLAGIMAASTGMASIAIASRFLMGITDDDDEDHRRFVPPWQKNSLLAYVGRGDDGKPRTLDLSYIDPYAYLRKPVMAMMRGDDWQESVWTATKEALTPFLGEEILAGKVVDVMRNTKVDGGRIWNPQDTLLQKATDASKHVGDALVPGTITSLNRIKLGMSGYVSPSGKSYDPAVEALAMLTGQRITEIDIPQALSFNARRHQRDLTESTQIMSKTAGSKGSLTTDELRSSVKRMTKARREVFSEATADVQAAMRQGVSRAKAMSILRDAGMSEATAKSVVNGKYLPYELSSAMKARIRESAADAATYRERLAVFNEGQ